MRSHLTNPIAAWSHNISRDFFRIIRSFRILFLEMWRSRGAYSQNGSSFLKSFNRRATQNTYNVNIEKINGLNTLQLEALWYLNGWIPPLRCWCTAFLFWVSWAYSYSLSFNFSTSIWRTTTRIWRTKLAKPLSFQPNGVSADEKSVVENGRTETEPTRHSRTRSIHWFIEPLKPSVSGVFYCYRRL